MIDLMRLLSLFCLCSPFPSFFQFDEEFAGFIAMDKDNVRKLDETKVNTKAEHNTAAAPFYDKLKDVSRRSCCFMTQINQ